ncbi:MAG TPA: HNH endonuclease [Polyangiaceae bacterium]|nr:HNH endonuclease [Polyangiaceae bacterium]
MGHAESRLRVLSDEQLLAGLASVVKRRNQVTAEFLAYLAEFDERRLYLDLGFTSLFEYCVQALRLCESTAGRHIAAARVCRAHPRVFAWVASGELHASALSLLKKYLTSENATELFECCRKQSARQVEELLAARFPKPDVRDSVRRLPARTEPALNVGRTLELDAGHLPTRVIALGIERPIAEAPQGAQGAKQACQALPNERTDTSESTEAPPLRTRALEPTKPRRIEPLSAGRYGVHFTADGEFCQLLERVRGLAGHRSPSGDLLTLLKRGLEAYERELQKERFAVGRKPRRRSNAEAASSAPSVVTASLGKLGSAKPVSAEPVSAEPVSAESVSAESVSAELVSAEPVSAELWRQLEAIPLTSARENRTWHCPAAVAREVFVRDGGQCSFVSADGRRCDARRRLELDHIVPRALGGEDSVRNLRLRCRAHNQHYARQCFGAARVHAAERDSCWRRSVHPQFD